MISVKNTEGFYMSMKQNCTKLQNIVFINQSITKYLTICNKSYIIIICIF